MGEIMRKKLLSVMTLIAGVCLAQQSLAQNEMVVVTGTSIRGQAPVGANVISVDRNAIEGDASEVPSVTLQHRADHLVTLLRVVCDTREVDKRKEELKETLRNMIRAGGQSQTISLSVGDVVLTDLTEKMLDKIIVPDTRPDSSQAFVVIKTKISAVDTFDDATQRISSFIDKTVKVGRTEIIRTERWDLTLVGPQQYRGTLINLIAQDANKTRAEFGSDYSVTAEGLQQKIAWYQVGALDLALFIPYRLIVHPK